MDIKRRLEHFWKAIEGNFYWWAISLLIGLIVAGFAAFRHSIEQLPPDARLYAALVLVTTALCLFVGSIAAHGRSIAPTLPRTAAPQQMALTARGGSLEIEVMEGYIGWVPDTPEFYAPLPEIYLLLRVRVAAKSTSLSIKQWKVNLYEPLQEPPDSFQYAYDVSDFQPTLAYTPEDSYNRYPDSRQVGVRFTRTDVSNFDLSGFTPRRVHIGDPSSPPS